MIMMNVVIVGAGPSGLFTAYELITKNKNLKVTILDEGRKVKTRVCPMNKQGIPCQNCNPCNILSGYGGAGTFSDGKLNFIPKLGKSDLTKYMSFSDANKLIDDTEEIFNKFGMDAKVYPSNTEEAEKIRNKVTINGAKLLLIKQKHLGSDHLPEYIDGICDYLIENGIGNGIYYPIPLYNQVLYKEMGYDQALPVTDEIVEEVLSLPIHAKLTEEDLDYMIKVIKEFF